MRDDRGALIEVVIPVLSISFVYLIISTCISVCLTNYTYKYDYTYYTSLKNMSRRSVFWHCDPSKRSGLFQWTSVGMTLMWISLSVRNGQFISFQLQRTDYVTNSDLNKA